MATLPPRTTRYNSAQANNGDPAYMLLRRWIETYEFQWRIAGEGGARNYCIELAPEAARRLVRNLTAALRANGHWKD